MAPTAPVQQDARDPSFQPGEDPLAQVLQNQQHMKQSLQSIAGSLQQLVQAIDGIRTQATGANTISGITLMTVVAFFVRAARVPRESIIAELQAGVMGGEVEEVIQDLLGGPQG